jgi:hypothetical protein
MAVPSPEDIAQNPITMKRPSDRLMAEAVAIIDTARRHDVQLRLTGGLAVRRYTTDLDFMDRDFSDIDFIGLSRQSARLRRVIGQLGYEENRYVSQATAGAHLQYLKRARLLESRAHMLKRPRPPGPPNVGSSAADHIDIFLDVMRMDHDIDVRGRLDMDPYAVSPADALLTKLQIGEMADKDVHDVIALLKDVPLSETNDGVTIDVSRLACVCARDWSIFYDVTSNLEVISARVAHCPLSETEGARVRGHMATLRETIAGAHESLRWRLRARVGTRLSWRRRVEEREGSPVIAPAPSGDTFMVLSCAECRQAVEISTQFAHLPAAPLACPRCGSLDLTPQSPEVEEPAAA